MLPLGDIIHQRVLSPSLFTPSEQQLLMTLWCFCGAPLIMGGNLPPSSNATLQLLTNARLLDVHGAAHGRRVLHPSGTDTHAWGAIPNEAPAQAYVALINAGEAAQQNVTLPLASLSWMAQGGAVCATELWTGQPAGAFGQGVFFATVQAHAALAFRLAAC
jgi:hypothetical protein